MLTRVNNQEFIKTVVGANAWRGLGERKVTLALVQAANLMALEGITRATASEIADRVLRQYEVEVTPSNVGQSFSILGIRTVTTHGKNKFVLDSDQLEKIHCNIEKQCHELETKLVASIESFKELPERIQALEKQWQEIQKLRLREREFTRTIQEGGQTMTRLYNLQDRARQIREQIKQADALEKECEELSQTVKKLPALTERKNKLESDIAEYQKEVNILREHEANLARLIEDLKLRKGWVTLASLNEAIANANQQLAQVNKQINERRSLLDRILHHNPGDIR